jgi:alcohol dehydrogenase class IV
MMMVNCPVLFGPGCINEVGGKFKDFGSKKVLIVVDKIGAQLGFTEKMKQILKDSGIESVAFEEAEPDPPARSVDMGGKLAKEAKIDGIVGIGGGSVLDTAKGINVLVNNSGSINEYFLTAKGPVPYKPGVPLLLLPTTAGTGSEVSGSGMITSAAGEKRPVPMRATLGVVDPELAVSLPPAVTAGCGLDAFAHAAESMTNTMDNIYANMLATDAIGRITKFLPIAVKDGKNIEARTHMSFSASMAVIGLGLTRANLGHACAHTIGAAFHLPHGDLCGMCLPETTRRNAQFVPEKIRRLGELMGLKISPGASPKEVGDAVASGLYDFLRTLGVKSLKDRGLKREDLVDRHDLTEIMMRDVCWATAPANKMPAETFEDIWVKFYDDYQ